MIAEYDGEGTLIKEYTYSNNIDEVLLTENCKLKTINYLHQDGLNSVVAITDNAGDIVQSYTYEAFGEIKESSSLITYTGRWLEPETGDYFYRARFYDAATGRFLSQDPIRQESGDYNFYRYVGNGVVNANDPLGLAYFAKRSMPEHFGTTLDGDVYTYNYILDKLNLETYHEHLFFEDGKLPSNIGFFGHGLDSDNPKYINHYRIISAHWDDNIMRCAVKIAVKKYSLAGNNCQNWAEKVRKTYYEIKNNII